MSTKGCNVDECKNELHIYDKDEKEKNDALGTTHLILKTINNKYFSEM